RRLDRSGLQHEDAAGVAGRVHERLRIPVLNAIRAPLAPAVDMKATRVVGSGAGRVITDVPATAAEKALRVCRGLPQIADVGPGNRLTGSCIDDHSGERLAIQSLRRGVPE